MSITFVNFHYVGFSFYAGIKVDSNHPLFSSINSNWLSMGKFFLLLWNIDHFILKITIFIYFYFLIFRFQRILIGISAIHISIYKYHRHVEFWTRPFTRLVSSNRNVLLPKTFMDTIYYSHWHSFTFLQVWTL